MLFWRYASLKLRRFCPMTVTRKGQGFTFIATPKPGTMNGSPWLCCSKLLADGWEQINIRQAEYAIPRRIQGANVAWKGWYAFRRGLSTNLYRLSMRPEEVCLVLGNCAEVVRKHYLRLEQKGTRIDAKARQRIVENYFNNSTWSTCP